MDPAQAMSHCWPTIAPCLDLRSLLSASRSCRTVRDVTVDAVSGRIRCPIMEIEEGGGVQEADVIHAPSVERLELSLHPRNVSPWADALAEASRLEDLTLDACSLVGREEGEKGASLRRACVALGEGLAGSARRSRRLRCLRIFSDRPLEEDTYTDFDGSRSHFSAGLLAAMVPVIREGRDSLKEVVLLLGDTPSTRDHPSAGSDLFDAIFQLRRLKFLRIQLVSAIGPLLNDLMEAAAAVGETPFQELEEISIMVADRNLLAPASPSLAPLLHLCGNTGTLKQIFLYVPGECWNRLGVSALGRVFDANADLATLVSSFDGYGDRSGRLQGHFLRRLREGAASSLEKLSFLDLGYVDNKSAAYKALEGCRSPRDGESCVRQEDFGWTFEWERAKP